MALPTTLVLKARPADPRAFVLHVDALLRAWGDRSDDLRFIPAGEVTGSPGLQWFHWRHADDRDVAIHLSMDDVRRARYLQVRAPDVETRRLMTLALACHLPAYTVDELREAVCLEGMDDPTAYLRLALALGDYDTETSRLLRAGIEDPRPSVRAHVAAAIEFLGWPDLGEVVRRARRRETDPVVRQLLDRVSRSCS